MARIAGVDIPREKRVEIALTYIFGLGLPTSQKILAQANINPDTRVRDLTWRLADTLIWLDLPLPLVLWRLFWRTLRRVFTGEDLWGTGNTESLRNAFFSRQSILLYAMKTHRYNRRRFTIDCAFLGKEKTVVRLRSAREVERFLATA